MPARKIICPAPRDTERLSRIWVRGSHTSLVKQASNKKKLTNKQKKKIQDETETKTKWSNIWQGILLILYCTSLDILPAFAHKFINLYCILIIFICYYLILSIYFLIKSIYFLKNLSVLSSKAFKVMQRLSSLSVWLQYLREVGI